jgi:hypothetical protein
VFYHSQTNALIIDIEPIILRAISKTVDDLNSYGLLDIDNIHLDFKEVNQRNILYHHTIHLVCEHLIEVQKEGYKVFYFKGGITSNLNDVLGYEVDYSAYHLNETLKKILSGIVKHLPVMIYNGTVSYKELVKRLTDGISGEAVTHSVQINEIINNFDPSIYTFGKLKGYTKKYRLNFLSETYFNQFRTKKLWYTR